jgi:hypothetical protein
VSVHVEQVTDVADMADGLRLTARALERVTTTWPSRR